MKRAYIVKAYRTAVGKAPRGVFRFTRPDDLAASTIQYLMERLPQLDRNRIDDVIVGNAMPEAEQGLNVGRFISLMGLDTEKVPGMTVNRYCASGLETIAIATAKIESGMAECIIAGGTESMSYIPMGGFKPVPNYKLTSDKREEYYWGMGLTAEAVAEKYGVTREQQDEFALSSHKKALQAQQEGAFEDQIVPIEVEEVFVDPEGRKRKRSYVVTKDEGPRADTSIEALANLKPVFSQGGSVTAGNSSQMSDGAAFAMVMSEDLVKELNLEPVARLVSYAVVGVEPRLMGIGPIHAIPRALEKAGLNTKDLEIIELNEAFAAQAVAVIKDLDLDPEKVNPTGGAIAMGHPLGCTGAKLSVQLLDQMRRKNLGDRYGMVTMCVGTGQGAAGIYEFLR